MGNAGIREINYSITECWFIRKSKIKKCFAEMEDVEIFPISNIDDLVDDSLSQNISTCYDKININEIEKHQLCRDSIETTENIKSKSCVTHSSYMAICNYLYNNMRNNDQISNFIVGLLFELKQIIISKD